MYSKTQLMRALLALAATAIILVPSFASAEKIEKARLDAIAADLQARVDDGKLAGVVALVAKDGEVQMNQAFGYRDLENKVPMTTDSIFRIFSMTKPVAGTALMMLFDEGKFQLSDPVEKYIPEFKGMQVYKGVKEDGSFDAVPSEHPMTIRELMSHTGGLVYVPPLSAGPVAMAYAKAGILGRNTTLKGMISELGKIPLNHQPGSQWVYSISVDVQGYLVEVLSGQSFDTFLRERIFKPLGMKDTAFFVEPAKADLLARRYRPGKDRKLVSGANGPFLQETSFFSGGGGLTSTAADYLRFAQMHLNKGELDGKRILSEKSAEIMRTNQLPDNIDNIGPFYPGNQFGVDFAVVNDSKKADGMPVGSFWWWGIAGTWFWIDPVENVIFIGMIQHDDLMYARQVHSKTRNLIYNPL
ncbi:MAG: serine hydrolase domain-containing protein [Cellvibrionaceae bacterium]